MLHVAQELPHDYKHFVRYLLTSQQTGERQRGKESSHTPREIKFKCLRTAQITREACLIYVQLATIKTPLRHIAAQQRRQQQYVSTFDAANKCCTMCFFYLSLWHLSHSELLPQPALALARCQQSIIYAFAFLSGMEWLDRCSAPGQLDK